jgi:hypothetical protein
MRKTFLAVMVATTSLLGTTAFAAGGPERIGPFEQWSACERAGNQGMDDGQWKDYRCDGTVPNIWLYPQY